MVEKLLATNSIDQLQQAEFIIIRHAESAYNRAWLDVQEALDQDPSLNRINEEYKVMTNKSLFDAYLSEHGREQCEMAKEIVEKLPRIRQVYVSPMRRAIETAYRVFQNSEHFNEMTFTVLPVMRECLHTVCDIPVDFQETLDEFNGFFPNGIDTKLMQGLNYSKWYVQDLQEEAQTSINHAYVDNWMSATYHTMSETVPEHTETFSNLKLRVDGMKLMMKQVEWVTNLKGYPYQVALVGHSTFFKYMTTTSWDENGFPAEYVWMNNCEFVALDSFL